MAIGQLFKGKFRILAFSIGGLLLFVVIFGSGILLGWLWGSFQGSERGTEFSFISVLTHENDYRLVRVELHLCSEEVARRLRDQHRAELSQSLRRVLDQNFRTAGRGTFIPSDDALVLSSEVNQLLRGAIESQIRSIDEELRTREGTLVLAVTIYFSPEVL